MSESIKLAIGFWPLLFTLEAGTSFIIYETIGWAAPALLGPLLLLTDFFILVIYCYNFRRGIIVGAAFLTILHLFIGPLGIRWYFVDREAKRIISWAEAEKIKTGHYPDDLSGYVFQRPENRQYVDYYKDPYQPNMGFGVSYIVGTEDTNHHYDPENGWYYQDD